MTTPVNNNLTPQVQQWLQRVIAPEYADPQRTYNDVAAALFGISTLFPRTDVYTHEDGSSELLLNVHGTIPVIFRGATYNIPLTVWVPHQYPRQPPMAFVTPARDMLIRPGNHVDPNGRCYHPYLANWVNFSDGSNIVDLCDVLRGVFGREPPVYSKQTPVTRPVSEAPPPPLPPLPSELARRSPTPSLPAAPVPPPLPPLPREMVGSSPAAAPSPANARYSSYQQQQRPLSPREVANGNGDVRSGPLQGYRNQGPPPPPLPPAPHRAALAPQHQQQAPPYPTGSQLMAKPPIPPPHLPTPAQGSRSPPPARQYNRFPGVPSPPVQPPSLFHALPSHSPPIYPANSQFHHAPAPPPQTSSPKPPPPPLQPKKPPPIDIMSLPAEPPPSSSSPTASSPPPPPPNPEKDRLLRQISQALHSRAEAAHARTATTLEQAAAQREALMRAEAAMERERAELARIVDLCEKDSDILRERIAAAGEVIKDAEAREAPEIDTVVVAPTVVHTQLYDLVTEDMAIEDTIYVLGKALDKERISLDVFLKYTRTLAREQFLLRALVKKITSQIGVDG